jgi:hypothetical protein
MMDPTRPPPWAGLKNVLQIGNQDPILYVHNAGTEDEAVIYLLNNEQPKVEEFGRKRDALRTG